MTGVHLSALGALYLQEGRFDTGLSFLRAGSTSGPSQLPGLAFNVLKGVQNRLDA